MTLGLNLKIRQKILSKHENRSIVRYIDAIWNNNAFYRINTSTIIIRLISRICFTENFIN